MYMLNMVIILIVMYCNVVTAIDKIPTYLLRFNIVSEFNVATQVVLKIIDLISKTVSIGYQSKFHLLTVGQVSCFLSSLLILSTLIYV